MHRTDCLPNGVGLVIADPNSNLSECEDQVEDDEEDSGSHYLYISEEVQFLEQGHLFFAATQSSKRK